MIDRTRQAEADTLVPLTSRAGFGSISTSSRHGEDTPGYSRAEHAWWNFLPVAVVEKDRKVRRSGDGRKRGYDGTVNGFPRGFSLGCCFCCCWADQRELCRRTRRGSVRPKQQFGEHHRRHPGVGSSRSWGLPARAPHRDMLRSSSGAFRLMPRLLNPVPSDRLPVQLIFCHS